MRFRERLARFMYGRYGFDAFGKFIIYGSLVLMLISSFISAQWLYIISLAGFIYGYFRVFSKNTYKRSYENDRYLRCKAKVSEFFGKIFRKKGNGSYSSSYNSYSGCSYSKEYKIFKCPGCKQKLRVPRGKGKIQISCRKCGREFIRRT